MNNGTTIEENRKQKAALLEEHFSKAERNIAPVKDFNRRQVRMVKAEIRKIREKLHRIGMSKEKIDAEIAKRGL